MNLSEPTPHLSFSMQHRQGALAFDAAFRLTEPWTVLFGPSGSGKTTVLRAIAGLMRADQGRIVLHGAATNVPTTLFDSATGTSLPAYRRGVRLAAQVAALFPNMTVRQNIAYGVPSASAEIVEETLQRFRLTGLAESMPWKLSGGERQRVAVARAAASAITVTGNSLLLLDEPFAGLHLPLRDELLDDLRSWLAAKKTPVLSVTHDVGEAFQLAAEVIKFSDGRVLEQGPVETVLAEERTRLLEQLSRHN
ncbi:MAG TPA: ATP-binding cassette domain-containing protein [Edaphobacter sp.]|uniref:ATP-binding cassette domain-containing protein n=1 Tax=Edaphobacter sp. TaxID=1934404 RepID=UPI002C65273B|nr:ATP-binding cassette domain-containing protein [Edaphobacter sp.]HUZ97154.1 ATP-binding cassette domain-containing protein [Edaphobacter sp.]